MARENSIMNSFLSLIIVLDATGSVFAANEFYIVRGPDRHCTVMDKRPSTVLSAVGDTSYKTLEEAQAAIQRICTVDAEDGR